MTNQSIDSGKRFFKTAASTVIALFVILSIFASVVSAADAGTTDVKIIRDAEEITITTTETEPIEILTTAGITLEDDDKLDFSSYVEGEGGTIVIKTLKSVNVDYNGSINTYNVYGATVSEALGEMNITLADNERVNFALDEAVIDGMVLKIKPTFNVKVKADGKTQVLSVIEGTVEDLLSEAGITLGEDDYVKPSLKTALKANMTVKVYRVTYENKTVTKKIKYTTKTVKDDDMYIGETKVVTKGKKGKKKVTYRVKYVNGKKKSKKKIKVVVTKKATQKVVKVGTKQLEGAKDVKPNGVTSKWGYTVGQHIDGKYTHYCACSACNGSNSGITSSGKRIYNGMSNPYYIACNWLPLGTVLNVDGVLYTVVDHGGSGLSRVGRIDIFTPEGHAACYRYGTGPCDITIVRLGW